MSFPNNIHIGADDYRDYVKSLIVKTQTPIERGLAVMFYQDYLPFNPINPDNIIRYVGVSMGYIDGVTSIATTGSSIKMDLPDGLYYSDASGALVLVLPIDAHDHLIGESKDGYLKLVNIDRESAESRLFKSINCCC